MGRTKKTRPAWGWIRFWELMLDAVLAASAIASSALPVVLALGHLARFVALFLAGILMLAGAAQCVRANVRLRDKKYRPHPRILSLIQIEAAVARLWVVAGAALAALCLFSIWPPVVALAGAFVTAFVFLKGISSAGRSAEAEAKRRLSKGSAAEKCWRVQRWANWAASARLVPGTKCFYRLAHYVVPAGQVGPLHAAALSAVGLCFFAYVSLGLASVGTEIAAVGGRAPITQTKDPGTPPQVEIPGHDVDPGTTWLPTYAQSCPQLPNPLRIGHGLGELFKRDGAAKAGCGDRARPVQGTDAWVAAGSCEKRHEMRSVAVSAPGQAVILYGAAAQFAWTAALEGTLVGAETARPAGGELDIVETLGGNYVFARQSPSIVQGSENIKWCWEVTGVARPFEQLPPPLAWLWLASIRERTAWSWPVSDPSNGNDPVSFEDYLTGQLIATGGCETKTACHLSVGDEVWPYNGTAFVSLSEFAPYMPEQSE